MFVEVSVPKRSMKSTGKTCSKESHVPAVVGPSAQPDSITNLGTSPATLHRRKVVFLFSF